MRFAVWRRLRFFFRERYWWIVAFWGVVLVLVGSFLSILYPLFATALVGIGSSMIATMLVSFAGPDAGETYQKIIRMGVTEFYPNRKMVPNEWWVNSLESAQRTCILLGQAHGEWIRDDRFESALIGRLSAGIRIEIFFLDPTTSEASLREREDRHQRLETKSRIRNSIAALWAIRGKLNAAAKERLTVYTYDATPTVGVTWIGDWMLVTHYLAGFNNLTSPALRVRSNSDPRCPYDVYAKNVSQIREKFSTEVTENNIGKYINGEIDRK
jgi:Domain of unknown function (DUF5919)